MQIVPVKHMSKSGGSEGSEEKNGGGASRGPEATLVVSVY